MMDLDGLTWKILLEELFSRNRRVKMIFLAFKAYKFLKAFFEYTWGNKNLFLFPTAAAL